jgi:hypothetical protein
MANNNTNPEQREDETDSFLPEHIRELLAEVADLKKAGADALTDTLAHWLTAHYVAAAKSAARKAGTEGMDLKTLHGLIADVVALRHGDQTAERLRIEREWLAVASRDADLKWKRKIIIGLETLKKYADKHQEAKAAFDELARQVRHPFDPTESD